MFLDFDDDSLAPPRSTDICIVGAGVIGLAVASQVMAQSQRRVLVLEEGGLEDTEASSAVPAELHGGDLASGVEGSRARGFGGSSRRWGGQALPFTPWDLQERSFAACRGGWPISWEELNRYYPAADAFLGLSAIGFDRDLWRSQRLSTAFAGGTDLELSVSKYSPHAYLAHVHQGPIGRSQQADCLLHARVAWIEAGSVAGSLPRIVVRNRQGREATIEARVIVLCAGGIENPRILLHSQDQAKIDLKASADVVGRYYQDHVGFFAARLEPLDWRLFQHLFSSFIPGNQKYVPKLQLSLALQRRLGLLNVIGNLDVQEAPDAPRHAARRLYNSLRYRRPGEGSLRSHLDDLWRLLRAAPETVALLNSHWFHRRIALPRQGRFFLMANAESEPLAASRIILSEQRDAHGLRRAQVNWRVSDHTLRALQIYGATLRRTLETAGIAKVFLSPYLTDPEANWKERAYSLYHHMGATRMAASPAEGVVDAYGRVHGLAHVYVAGTSVLPSGSASNPSYTALALALRTTERILLES
jgi:choline dehydrogenase-like flavoprotein